MGYCREFGSQICEGCAEPMVAGRSACTCPTCGTGCRGRFPGCAAVWARGTAAAAPFPDDESQGVPAAPVRPRTVPRPRPRTRALALAPNHPALRDDPDAAWLRDEVAHLRDDLRRIGRTLQQQRGTVAELVQRQAAAERVVELAEVLPQRLGAAIAAAVESRQDAYLGELDTVTERLAECLGHVTAAADALRQEAARGSSDELGAAAGAIEGTATRVARRIAELAPPLGQAAHAAAAPPGPRRGPRSRRAAPRA